MLKILKNIEKDESFKQELKDSKTKGESKKSSDYRYYNKFVLSSDNQYKMLYRINNTVVYVDTRTKYKDDVLNVLKELGY